MARTTAQQKGHDHLGIYLNDHLAGATGGVGLARRMAAAADPGSESARVLSTLAAEITQDRAALIKIMGALGIPVRGYKVFAGWAGEKAGRAKLNGRLLPFGWMTALRERKKIDSVRVFALGVKPERHAQGFNQLGLGETGNADQQRVASGQDRHQGVFNHAVLTEDDGRDRFLGRANLAGDLFGRADDYVFEFFNTVHASHWSLPAADAADRAVMPCTPC